MTWLQTSSTLLLRYIFINPISPADSPSTILQTTSTPNPSKKILANNEPTIMQNVDDPHFITQFQNTYLEQFITACEPSVYPNRPIR